MKETSRIERTEARAHYCAAAVGGFLGLYPIVSAAHILGSAQTSNLIEVVLAMIAGDGKTVALHSAGALLYCSAIFFATILQKTKINMKIAALILDFASSIVMFLLPKNLNPAIYLHPTFFALAFHWCAFKGGYGFTSSVIFSTNNLRMLVSSLAEIAVNKNKSFELKALFFGATLFSYHAGIAFSFILWRFFGNAGFLFSAIPILFCAFFVRLEILQKSEH